MAAKRTPKNDSNAPTQPAGAKLGKVTCPRCGSSHTGIGKTPGVRNAVCSACRPKPVT